MSGTIQPSDEPASNDTSTWPLLLKDWDKMLVISNKFIPLPNGYSPLNRPIKEYLKYGVIYLDKPANPSSHEVDSWIKRILHCDKTGHSGTLDPQVTGVLVVCLNRATRLTKVQQNAGKEYMCVMRLKSRPEGTTEDGEQKVANEIKRLTGALLQRPPLQSAVAKRLRIRTIYESNMLEYHDFSDIQKKNAKEGENSNAQKYTPLPLCLFRVACEAGTYIRTLCNHIGVGLGTGAEMIELRRTRSGTVSEYSPIKSKENEKGNNNSNNGVQYVSNTVKLHDVLDAAWEWEHTGKEDALRRVVMPMEVLFSNYGNNGGNTFGDSLWGRLIIKDTSIGSIIHGSPIRLCGVLRVDPLAPDNMSTEAGREACEATMINDASTSKKSQVSIIDDKSPKGPQITKQYVAVSTKGEAIAIIKLCMTPEQMVVAAQQEELRTKLGNCKEGETADPSPIVASIVRVLIDRDLYPQSWKVAKLSRGGENNKTDNKKSNNKNKTVTPVPTKKQPVLEKNEEEKKEASQTEVPVTSNEIMEEKTVTATPAIIENTSSEQPKEEKSETPKDEKRKHKVSSKLHKSLSKSPKKAKKSPKLKSKK